MASPQIITPPYPGVLQRVGSTGPNVRIIQEYLNVIGRNHPSIPRLAEDGIFGPLTQASVIAFQRLFQLVPDGIVGPLTWAEIMRQYVIALTPTTPGFFNYTVVAGDTLWALSQRFGTTVDAIRSLNGLTSDLLRIGQVLRISQAGGVTPPQPPLPPPTPARTIVIDPGHGGSDSGAVSGTRREKDDNLRLALAVQRLLQAQGQRVIMTRTTDIFVTLAERSAISNRNNANIFVSLHRNSSTNTTANGVENYIFTTAPTIDALYAHNVLNEVVNAGVQNNRGVIRGNFAVLRNTNAPAMLLEMGFISNTRDNQLFDQNFNAYAAAITRGIITSLNGPSMPPPSFFFYTVVSGDNMPSLAQRFGTTTNAIMSLNNLSRNILITGQVLKIPSR
ncbi:MAG: N-acetylmuramoyl-L-alanine amidase [Firmicutes bacterium]|nr:N-acetylmuramoyl-L-alanine amidase [Bacillota bacterium]